MSKYLFEHTLDEFNYLISPSFEKKVFDKEGEFFVATHKDFDILMYEFDKIFVFDYLKNESKSIIDYFDQFPNERQIYFKKMLKSSIKNIDSNNLEIITRKFIQENIHSKGQHVYNFVFSNVAKTFLEEKIPILPKESDYKEIQKQLSKVDKKIICVNGRNLGKHTFRNQIFHQLISHFITSGYFIVNTTFNPPNLNFPKESYFELNSSLSYSKNISYFLNSECVISVADSGGINTHLLTGANFLLLGNGGWVDNPQFGYNEIDVVSARKNMKQHEIKTCHFKNNIDINEIINFIESCKKPKVDKFFDENKIIKIQDK